MKDRKLNPLTFLIVIGAVRSSSLVFSVQSLCHCLNLQSIMSAAFIGCKISLISKSEIRYEGILYTIDTKESTIALAKGSRFHCPFDYLTIILILATVRSYGTEDRVTDKPVAPRNEVYEYIIFRASDIKDLIVDDPPALQASQLTDPAIIQAVRI